MDNEIFTFKMIQELSGFKSIQPDVIDWCYSAVCKQYGLKGDKEAVLNDVRRGLASIFGS